MTAKARMDSVLFQLPEEQQSMIYQSIKENGYLPTVKMLALPEPDGLNLKTYPYSLRRFYQRYTRQLKLQDLADAAEIALPPDSSALLQPATHASIHHAAFELAHEPITIQSFNELSRWLSKQRSNELKAGYLRIAERHADLAEKRLALEREKAEINIARLALKHHLDFHEIVQRPGADDEDKIRAARDLIFGKSTPPHSQP